ncbi:MAG: GTPase Era [Chloroflexi bacterium]|nr:GTPase Era [Chloroflexota bacterium]
MINPDERRAGFVAVVGRPNVGKSTLVNSLLGQKIAAVTPRPQTTRRQQLGIITRPDSQIVLIDTPGIHVPHHSLGKLMNQEALQAFESCDAVLLVVDSSVAPTEEDRLIAERFRSANLQKPIVLALNKIDRLAKDLLEERGAAYLQVFPQAQVFSVSALLAQGLDDLWDALTALMPIHAPFYPEEQITDHYEREIAADLIRAAALDILLDEVPHSIAVRVDEFTERGDSGAYIAATLFVERESQVAIVVGKGGAMIKKVGIAARKAIEEMSGRKVHLELRVKVRKNWRNDDRVLKQFGFKHRRSN